MPQRDYKAKEEDKKLLKNVMKPMQLYKLDLIDYDFGQRFNIYFK